MSGSISKQITNKNVLFYFDAANERSYDGVSTTGYSLVLGTTASLLTGVTWSADRGGKMVINGTYSPSLATYNRDSWISCGSRISTLAPAFPLTLEAWINPRATGRNDGYTYGIFALDSMEQWGGISSPLSNYYGVDIALGSNDGSNTHTFGGGYYNGVDYGVAARKSSLTNARTIVCGTWSHVAAVFSGLNSITLYVNGATAAGTLSGNNSSGLAWSGGTGQTVIGKGAGYYKYLFDGSIAMVRAYNAALSGAEIKSNYDLHARRFGKS